MKNSDGIFVGHYSYRTFLNFTTYIFVLLTIFVCDILKHYEIILSSNLYSCNIFVSPKY